MFDIDTDVGTTAKGVPRIHKRKPKPTCIGVAGI